MASNQNLNSELESFRRQWLSDLHSKTAAQSTLTSGPSHFASSSSRHPARRPSQPSATAVVPEVRRSAAAPIDDEHDAAYLHGPVFGEMPQSGHTLDSSTSKPTKAKDKELLSALDHFEEAMIKEASGNMGDSLKLYRKAYKLDNGVDRRYREKHFPMASKSLGQKPGGPSAAKPEQQQQPGADQQEQSQQPQSMADLIASFSSLAIEGIPPEAEGMPQPPCPIAALPDELLVHVLLDVATQDVADFTRLSLVCKRFAYLVATEQRIWRDVCLADRFGFPGMLYHFSLAVEWDPLEEVVLDEDKEDGTLVSLTELDARRQAEKLLVTRALTPSIYASWKAMFRHRPRIRFNGIYISTVNYVRSGQASTNQATWGGSPIHIVTYYRYLRFFRDGAVISLLTTNEPGDVVHHVTKDALHLHRDRDKSHASALPSAVMYLAQKGRWRLSSALDYPEAGPAEQESDLFIETEGAGPKYMYRMNLSLRSAGKGAKNNKLIWRSFHSYNKLTDDWGEFTLKNDKPFFFSRVKSYGLA